jgi:hypothetical protein
MNENQIKYHNQLYYNISKDVGIVEIFGKEDHPKIALAHEICGFDNVYDIDTNVPWCSSMMNLWILQTNYQFNKAATQEMIIENGLGHCLSKIQEYAEGLKIYSDYLPEVPRPTWSAAASSWLNWGVDCKNVENSIAVFWRNGGNHVALFLKEIGNNISVLGGNQKNMVCVSNAYEKKNLLKTKIANI